MAAHATHAACAAAGTAYSGRLWGYPSQSLAGVMPSKPCPTLGCREWTANGGGQWHILPPDDSFSLQLDSNNLALHRSVCNECWNCHRCPKRSVRGRHRQPSPFEQLLDAAAALTSPPPSTSSVKQLTPRRSWTLKEKESICSEWSRAQSHAQKLTIRDKYRAGQLDGHQVQQWREALARNSSSP